LFMGGIIQEKYKRATRQNPVSRLQGRKTFSTPHSKTLSFANSDFYHELFTRLFIVRYNLTATKIQTALIRMARQYYEVWPDKRVNSRDSPTAFIAYVPRASSIAGLGISKCDLKGRALVLNTLDTDASAQCLDNGFDDVQADATAGDFGDRNVFRAVEPLEEVRHRLGRNAKPAIGY
jgi:hypothetical protein